MRKGKTQNERILERLRTRPLTTYEAVADLHILSVTKRISELRLAGHEIETDYRTTDSGARYGVYTLVREAI